MTGYNSNQEMESVTVGDLKAGVREVQQGNIFWAMASVIILGLGAAPLIDKPAAHQLVALIIRDSQALEILAKYEPLVIIGLLLIGGLNLFETYVESRAVAVVSKVVDIAEQKAKSRLTH